MVSVALNVKKTTKKTGLSSKYVCIWEDELVGLCCCVQLVSGGNQLLWDFVRAFVFATHPKL